MDWRAACHAADQAMSSFARKRDCLASSGNMDWGVCITCQKMVPYSQLDNGHFMDRACMATRFHPKNNNAQCIPCNRFADKATMKESYGHAVERKWGKGTRDELFELKKQTANFSVEDLLEIARVLRRQYREL